MAFLEAALLKHDVEFLHSAGYISEAQGLALIVRNRRAYPVLPESRFKELVY